MTNTIILLIDTDNPKPIQFSKPEGITPPATKKEFTEMVKIDLDCMSEGLVDLIFKADLGGFANMEEEVKKAIGKLQNLLALRPDTNIEEN